METSQWVLDLLRAFPSSRQGNGPFALVLSAEHSHDRILRNQFSGYFVRLDAFQLFFAETLVMADSHLRDVDPEHHPRNYGLLLLTLTNSFQKMRAANFSLTAGYPLPGYVLLRSLKDCALVLGAVGNKYTTISRASGSEGADVDPQTCRQNLQSVRKARKKEESHIFACMLRGENSGLSAEIRSELSLWEDLFNEEVHASNGFVSLAGIPWMLGQEQLPVAPAPDLIAITLFMNCSWEVAWLLLRLLPLLQLRGGKFGVKWAADWRLLDDSFALAAEGFSAEGKLIGKAIAQLVSQKFAFSPNSTYYLNEMG